MKLQLKLLLVNSTIDVEVGSCAGVAMAAGLLNRLREYRQKIKMAITGNGNATKSR
jgi:Holliday junction resolvasome RuvABC endonuclease subunit